jgi:hypothetical protein
VFDTPIRSELLLCLDVFEHVEDYIGFLKRIKLIAPCKIFHIPLDISVQSVARASQMRDRRETVGHLHFFTRETAIDTLQHCGYRIVDQFYTASTLDLDHGSWKSRFLALPRRIGYAFSPDLAVRVLGGWSMMVVAI